jgi:hypothetical protein
MCSLFLGTYPLDRVGVVRESQGCDEPQKVCIFLSFEGDLIVKTELDLGDRSERIRVERDPAFCELFNGDVGIICEWLNFGNKSCIYCACSF